MGGSGNGFDGGCIAALVKDEMERVRACRDRSAAPDAISTGIAALDCAIGGLRAGEIVLLAGRPLAGHHELALNIAAHAAVERAVSTGFFSTIDGWRSVVRRLLANLSGVVGHRVADGQLDDADRAALDQAASRLAQAALFIEDAPHPTFEALADLGVRLRTGRPVPTPTPGLLVVLGLDRFAGEEFDAPPEDRLRAATSVLREGLLPDDNLAVVGTLDLPGDGTMYPQIDDVRRLGLSEDDPEALVLVHGTVEVDQPREWHLELMVVSQRRGPRCSVGVRFDPDLCRIGSAASE
jgi:replicative DNA helicase